MEESEFLKRYGDTQELRVLEIFLEQREIALSIEDINEELSFDAYTIVKEFFDCGALRLWSIDSDKKTLFKLNMKNIFVRQFLYLYDELIREILER